MKHRIITDGKKFRVETRGGKKWELETYQYSIRYIPHPYTAAYEFNSARSATRFIRKKYGTSAEIEPRTWRPI